MGVNHASPQDFLRHRRTLCHIALAHILITISLTPLPQTITTSSSSSYLAPLANSSTLKLFVSH